MRDLIIYGAGGFGRETALMVKQINQYQPTWNLIGFGDDGIKTDALVNGVRVLGGKEYIRMINHPIAVAIAIADPEIRKKLCEEISSAHVSFPSLVHPSVLYDSATLELADGCIITAGSILTTNVTIGSFTIINLMCTIGHDVEMKPYCSLMPRCSLGGSVKLGEGVFMGTGAQVFPGVSVGAHARVGAGSVVTRDVPEKVTVIGVPARGR